MKNSDKVYLELLEERKKEIISNIDRINRLNQNKKNISTNDLIQLKGYQIELQELQEAIDNYTERRSLSDITENRMERIEQKYQKAHNKSNAYKEEIEELKALKERLIAIKAKRKVDRRIEKLEVKIKDMEQKKVTCSNKQRKKMLPKYKRDFYRNSLLARQKGRIKEFEDRLSDNEELKNMFNRDNLIDNIKERIYDIKGHFYMKKIAREEEILKEMQKTSSRILMHGARITSLNKKFIEKLRERSTEAPTLGPVM